MAFREAARRSSPVLLEPVMKVEVVVPEAYMGDVIADLNSRRGKVRSMEAHGGTQIINASVPLAEMFGYATELRSRTQGRATYTMHFDRYEQVSDQLMTILREMADLVEPLSLDEAYLDVTESVAPDRTPGMIAAELRARVRAELGLTISVGVATSKSVAKIASDMNKPDGMTVVPPGSEREFLAPLEVKKLWGIGPKTSARLEGEGISTIGELASRPEEWWLARFGRTGPHLRRLALGNDDSPVVEHRERKSVSAETTLAQDTGDPDILLELTERLSQRVAAHLVRTKLRGRTVKLKLRLSDFTTFTRQTTVAEPVASPRDVASAVAELLRRELEPGRRFRLVGVGVSGFEHPEESPLQPRLEGFE